MKHSNFKRSRQFTITLEKDDFERFQRLYPSLAGAFLRRCVVRALQDSSFFADVFFSTADSLYRSSCLEDINNE